MVINTEKLKELKPCTGRFRNWLEHYPSFEGSLKAFLDLDKITYDDKIYVVRRLGSRDVLEQWAALCAESVLHIFEKRYPDDKRPRECIDYLKSGVRDKEMLLSHWRSCRVAAAAYAAAAAAYAAAAAADSATYTYADAAAAADAIAATYAYAADDDARKEQQAKNLELLKSLL